MMLRKSESMAVPVEVTAEPRQIASVEAVFEKIRGVWGEKVVNETVQEEHER